MNYRITLAALLTGFLMIASAPPADAGIAIAIARYKDSDQGKDVKYFIRYNSTSSGHQMAREARKDFKEAYASKTGAWYSAPSTRDSGSLQSGNYVIVRYEDVDYKGVKRTTFALGYGSTASKAQADAHEELARRNWSWNKSKGYTVERSGSF